MLETGKATAMIRRAIGIEPSSVTVVPHHDSHALEAFAPSGFDEALVVVVDSAGNLLDGTVAGGLWENETIYRGVRRAGGRCDLELLARDFTPGFGYGQLFRAVTRYVGFPGYHHASKVMAMAGIAHDRESPLPPPHQPLSSQRSQMAWPLDGSDPVPSLCAWLDHLGFDHPGPRSQDWYAKGTHEANGRASLRPTDLLLAAWVQRGWEQHLTERVGELAEQTGIRRVCMGGGVALNCVANARLLDSVGVDAVHVGVAPGDHGQGLGNLVALLNERAPEHIDVAVRPPYFGGADREPSCDPAEAAERLLHHQILAVCRGTAEYGPRALGHRSLLALPVSSVAERLRAVKQREDYQPFAVCLTSEYAVEKWSDCSSPYMSFAPSLAGQGAIDLADVLHDDGTCRLQTVSADSDPWLHELLGHLKTAGQPPVLVNTSLNLRGEPMVDEASDAQGLADRFGVDGAVVDRAAESP
jgi:carbamoyltransferase